MPLISLSKRTYKKQYVEKKKTDSGEVRIYSEQYIKKRWKKKVEKLKKLEGSIGKLRKQYKEDLKSSNSTKTQTIAALVGLIDNTAIRIGNDASVKENCTFGATTLQKQHATVMGNKIRFKFKGKKGVDQDITLSDPAVTSKIKKLLIGKKNKDYIFTYDDSKRVRAKTVNRYLGGFGITAKDLRGFHANHLMKERLGPNKDFEKVLEDVANEIGHEPKTLMNHYLDPELVHKYYKKDNNKSSKKKESSLKLPLSAFAFDLKKPTGQAAQEIESIFHNVFNGGPATPATTVVKTQKETSVNKSLISGKSPNPSARITSRWGKRKHPISGKLGFHKGVDIGVRTGTPIYAMSSGKILSAHYSNRGGLGIQIVHPANKDGVETKTFYGHLSKIEVHSGDTVSTGQLIGYSGATGQVTGPHLHFGVRQRQEGENKWISVDPTPFYQKFKIWGTKGA